MLMLSSRSHFPPGAYTRSTSSKIQTEFIIVLALVHTYGNIWIIFNPAPKKSPNNIRNMGVLDFYLDLNLRAVIQV